MLQDEADNDEDDDTEGLDAGGSGTLTPMEVNEEVVLSIHETVTSDGSIAVTREDQGEASSAD